MEGQWERVFLHRIKQVISNYKQKKITNYSKSGIRFLFFIKVAEGFWRSQLYPWLLYLAGRIKANLWKIWNTYWNIDQGRHFIVLVFLTHCKAAQHHFYQKSPKIWFIKHFVSILIDSQRFYLQILWN